MLVTSALFHTSLVLGSYVGSGYEADPKIMGVVMATTGNINHLWAENAVQTVNKYFSQLLCGELCGNYMI